MWAHLTLTAAIAAWLGLAALAAWRRWPPAGAARGLAAGLAGGSAAGLLLSAPVLRRTLKFVARNVGVPPAAGLHPGPLEPSAALTVAGGGSTSLAIALLLAAAVGIASLLRSRDRRLLGVALAAPLAAALALIAARALGYPGSWPSPCPPW